MTSRTFEELRHEDITRREWLGLTPGHDPQVEPEDEAWREDTWTDDVLRRTDDTKEAA